LHVTALKDAARRQGGGPSPSLTAITCNAWENIGRDEKTALQPNQKTERMTDIFCESRSNGIDTGTPVTEAHLIHGIAGVRWRVWDWLKIGGAHANRVNFESVS
jgi:hypothetical protein